MHFTPVYSSWINEVERWFVRITEQLDRRGDHRSVRVLEAGILSVDQGMERRPETCHLDQDR